MLKTTQSYDGSLGLQSHLSPIRYNKSSKFYQTAASSQYSQFANNSPLLRINSVRSFGHELTFPKLNKFQSGIEIQTTPRQVSESRMKQLQQFQKWVSQSFFIYNEGQRLLRDNQEKIRIMQHKNRLKKDEIAHIKTMGEYFKQKYQQSKKQLKKKLSHQQSKVKLKIKQSKQRTQQLCEQIQYLKSEINEQKRLQMEIKIKRKRKTQQSQTGARPFFYQQHYGYYPPNMYMYPQFQSLQNIPTSLQNSNLHSFHPSYIQKNPQELASQSKTNSMVQLKRSPSFDKQTARFLSKKVSIESHSEPINNNFIIQALTAQIGRLAKPNTTNSNLKRSAGQLSGKWQNTQQQKDVLNILQGKEKTAPISKKIVNKKNLTISQDFESSTQNVLYSPTNAVQTPGFDQYLNQYQKGKGVSFSSIRQQQSNPFSSSTSTPQKRQSNKRTAQNVQESKIRIQVDQSVSQHSKFSIQKRRKTVQQGGLKQSAIKIDVLQDESRSGQNSMQKDAQQNSARSRKKSIPTKPANQSLQKIQVQQRHSSQILVKNSQNIINSPPKLPLQKKLRKVTQQQSDLFDSYGQPRMSPPKKEEKKINNDLNQVNQNNYNSINSNKQKSDTVSVKDVYIDNLNIKQSIAVPFNWQTIPTSRTTKQQKIQNIEKKQQMNPKEKTQQEDDEDDFMNVNLLAVSKISKQKQLSERAFNTLSDEANQSFNKKNLVRKSYNPQQVPLSKSQIPIEDIIEEQNDFYDDEKEKRQQNLKRARKNSGSRFSILFQPNTAQSMEFKSDQII